jgi:hypothetical protein
VQGRTLDNAIRDAELVEDALLRLGKGAKEDITELRGAINDAINAARNTGREPGAAPAAISPELLACIHAKAEFLRPITLVDLNADWTIGKGFRSSVWALFFLCILAVAVAVAALPLWSVHAEYETARRGLAAFNETEFRRIQADAAYAWVDLRCGGEPNSSPTPRRGMLTTYRDNSFRLISQLEHLSSVSRRLTEIGRQHQKLPHSQLLSPVTAFVQEANTQEPRAADLTNEVLVRNQITAQRTSQNQQNQLSLPTSPTVLSLGPLILDDIAVMIDVQQEVRSAAPGDRRHQIMQTLVNDICNQFGPNSLPERNIYRGLQRALAHVYLEIGVTPERLVSRDWVRELQTRVGDQLRLSGLVILPALFGCLGAIFWSLRRLLNPTSPTYSGSGTLLRLVFGALAGVLLSWLFQSGWGFDPARPYEVAPGVMRTPDGTLGVILVGALVVGYSIEVMFVALDRLVELLSRLVSGRDAGQAPPARP